MAEFDWVRARFECSISKVFVQVRLEVEQDVIARNAQLEPDAPYKFAITSKGDNFTAAVQSRRPQKYVPLRSVTFSLGRESISVQDNNGKMAFDATLTLNDDGECRLKVKGKEREFWQFRRMALDRLLFDPVDPV